MKVTLTMGLGVALATASAIANSPFHVQAALIAGSSPSAPVVTCVETAPNSGIWDIEIALANAVPPANGDKAQLAVLVENSTPGLGTGDKIGTIRIDAKDHFPFDGKADLEARLQLGGTDPLTADIDWIGLADSVFDTDLLLINPSFVKGSVGTIAVNWIEGLIIDGNVAEVLTSWNQGGVYAGTANSVGNLTVTGDVTGTIYVGHGTADRIAIGGDVGSPTAEASVFVRCHLLPFTGKPAISDFSCQNLYANLQVGSSNLDYAPEVVQVLIQGDQHGFMYLPMVVYSATPPLQISGDIRGDVIVGSTLMSTPDDRAVRVFGDIQASGSVSINRWGDLAPTGQPKTVVGISGTVSGRMSLGSLYDSGAATHFGAGSLSGVYTQVFPGGFNAGSVLEFQGNIATDGVLNITEGFAGQFLLANGASLAGQVIINSDASGSDLFTGSAVLDFDTFPVSLTPIPNYSNLSAELGGGAIGVVPFNLHATDSEPPSGSLITVHTGLNGIQPPDAVRIRHYGPVRLASASSQLLVERADFTAPPDWETVSNDYQFAISSENPRDLIVTGDFGPDYRYRIRPNGEVLCAGNSILDAGSFPVFDYTYNLRVRTPLDRNMNGMMEFGDIELQVADPIDINGDTAADVLDLAEVIQAVANP